MSDASGETSDWASELSDPFSGYAELLRRMTDGVRRDSRRRYLSVGDVAESVFEDAELEVAQAAASTWTARSKIEAAAGARFEHDFRPLDTMLGIVYAVGRLMLTGYADRESHPPDDVKYSFAFLHTRALKLGNEISALLRAGFPEGAKARWRTLHEIEVTARVLLVGNRGTAARFINHRWIIFDKDPAAYFPQDETFPEVERKVRREARKYTRRYGAAYTTNYGWASELTKRKLGVKNPRMEHLRELAERASHYPTVQVANHLVHPDSLSALYDVNADGIFHAGASFGRNQVFWDTVRSLDETMYALLMTWGSYGGGSAIESLIAVVGEAGLMQQRDYAFGPPRPTGSHKHQ